MRSRNLETMFVLACVFFAGRGAALGQTTRVSVSSAGAQGDSWCMAPALTPDGRYVAFASGATNLVDGQTSPFGGAYVHDRVTGTTECVSVDSNGVQGNSYAASSSISSDGRFVAFMSLASNLVAGDTDDQWDIFVHDRLTGLTERVSVDSNGAQENDESYAPCISSDGRFVAFSSFASNLVGGDTNGCVDVFVHDRLTGITERASVGAGGAQGNGGSSWPSIASDGRFVAFASDASNLVAGDTNGATDVFVRDRVNGVTERVSIGSSGVEGNSNSVTPSISSDGRFVAFDSVASNLVAVDTNFRQNVFVRDRSSGITELVSVDSTGLQGNSDSTYCSISADGRFVTFISDATNLVLLDTNYVSDVFLRDRSAGVTDRITSGWSWQANGGSWETTISADGRVVAFSSDASNLVSHDTNDWVDVFVHDRSSDATTVRASLDRTNAEANGASLAPAVSANGQFIAFQSDASSLVPNDANGSSDVFVRDAYGGTTERVSVGSAGNESNGAGSQASISADGSAVAFTSDATNLVPNDVNGAADVFVHDRTTGSTERVSVDEAGVPGNDMSDSPAISADGQVVAFRSHATNLVANDSNAAADVFVHDRTTGLTARVSVNSSKVQGNGGSCMPAIGSNGQMVAFASYATNLADDDTNGSLDVFLHNRATRVTERVSVDSSGRQGNGDSRSPAISTDGRYVAFESLASNLVEGDTNGTWDIFLHDCVTGRTTRVSVDTAGGESDGESHGASISADGRFVTFTSLASNLVAADGNGLLDVFTYDCATGRTERMSVDLAGADGDGASGLGRAAISADARFVVLDSLASNLVAGDLNGCSDVFVRDRRSAFAIWWNYGAGFPGTTGVPAFTPRSEPVIGTTVTLDLANSYGRATAGLLFLGFEQTRMRTGSGDLLLVPSITQFIGLAPAGTSFSGSLPNDMAWIGFFIDLQAIEFDPGAVRGVSFTQGLELVFGL